jgi:hypothetical protein
MQLLIKKKGSPPQTKDSGSPVETILFLCISFHFFIIHAESIAPRNPRAQPVP